MLKLKKEHGLEYEARLKVELHQKIDKRLRAVLLDLAYEVERKYKKDIIITCLERTEKENLRVNGSPFSSHMDKRGADIRSSIFSIKELDFIENYMYTVYGRDFIYVKIHNAGSGDHIHINIRYEYRKKW